MLQPDVMFFVPFPQLVVPAGELASEALEE